MPLPPQVPFVKTDDTALEFEVISLRQLFSRREDIAHPIEQPHRTEFHSLIFFTEGHGTQSVDFQPHDYAPGSVCVIRRGQVNAFSPGPDRDGILILFTEAFITKNLTQSDALTLNRFYGYDLQSPMLKPPEPIQHSLTALLNEITSEYETAPHLAREETLRLLLKLILLKIERVRRDSLPEDRNLSSLLAFGEFQNLLLTHLTKTRNAQDYAKLLKMSYRQLNLLCKKATGKTAKAFIDEAVILEAKRQLATTAISVKELSFDLGFDNPTNFIQFFKNHTAMLPGLFRQNGRV